MIKSIFDKLRTSKNTLVVAVGGGNDSVSALIPLEELKNWYAFTPENIDILAVLPDVLSYTNVSYTEHVNVFNIHSCSSRYAGGRDIGKFPEAVLAKHVEKCPVKVSNVYGMLISNGSIGAQSSLQSMIDVNKYDLILALDVGGDFISSKDNHGVLSPMMDGYMLYALSALSKSVPVIYGVYGLGTDGESSGAMLIKALSKIDNIQDIKFHASHLSDSISFYKRYVEPVRYSRTADYTIKAIVGDAYENPSQYRARFHVEPADGHTLVEYAYFEHEISNIFEQHLYLFEDVSKVDNHFNIPCSNSLEWFIKVQNNGVKYNTELNGQTLQDLSFLTNALSGFSLFFGTPSAMFSCEQQLKLADAIVNSVKNNVYDFACMWSDYVPVNTGLYQSSVTPALSVVCKDELLLSLFVACLNKKHY